MEVLLQNFANITWQSVVMWGIGGILIYLAIVKEMEPEIEGVLIAAQGGDQNQVAGEITQAVQVLFDIPVHKIKVVKMKDQ